MKQTSGFTLIEISVVLVIIGLLVGGILTGRDLMDAAAQRAQITQIERYNTAVRTFQGKYGGLPGDLPDPMASQFGFQARGNVSGEGNGDGLILGQFGGPGGNQQNAGETTVFWVDLSTAGLIDGGFKTASELYTYPDISGTAIALYFPPAKIGDGNFVYVYDGGYWNGSAWISDGINYYGISVIKSANPTLASNLGLTVQQAYNIDKKIDDGLPQSGNVIASYIPNNISWAGTSNQAATPGSFTTCYDNNNTNAATQKYSVNQNGGNGLNCALSFKFQ